MYSNGVFDLVPLLEASSKVKAVAHEIWETIAILFVGIVAFSGAMIILAYLIVEPPISAVFCFTKSMFTGIFKIYRLEF